MDSNLLLHPFTLGLLLGLIFAALAFYQLLRVRGEFKRFKRHLSDKLEIDADSITKIRKEQETLRKENEHLRVKVQGLNETPDRKVQRDLEIFARAERRMLISVPGFAPAWESAKESAFREIEEEERGNSLPKKVFTKFFGSAQQHPEQETALPPRATSPAAGRLGVGSDADRRSS